MRRDVVYTVIPDAKLDAAVSVFRSHGEDFIRRAFRARRLSPLGCGSFSCAWRVWGSLAWGDVVKLTVDVTEPPAAKLIQRARMRGRDVPHVVEIKDVRAADFPGVDIRAFCLVMEFVPYALPDSERTLWDEAYQEIKKDEMETERRVKERFMMDGDIEGALRYARTLVGRYQHKLRGVGQAKEYLDAIMTAIEAMARIGVLWLDVHSWNFGFTDPRLTPDSLKIFDLGFASVRANGRVYMALHYAEEIKTIVEDKRAWLSG